MIRDIIIFIYITILVLVMYFFNISVNFRMILLLSIPILMSILVLPEAIYNSGKVKKNLIYALYFSKLSRFLTKRIY